MQPQQEEVQQAVNKAVQCIICVSKGVSQWCKELHCLGDERPTSPVTEVAVELEPALVSYAPSESSRSEPGERRGRRDVNEKTDSFYVQPQLRNYFKNVNENKEVAKLVSLLSISINSTKKVRASNVSVHELSCHVTLMLLPALSD